MYIKHLEALIIDKSIKIHQVKCEASWMDLIIKYLTKKVLPKDLVEAKRVRWMALQYITREGVLYKRSFTLSLLKCLGSINADNALKEVHKGIYGDYMEVDL